ncbi:hypothetical protein LJC42_07500 [Eubacteriales bacterium OttesenSCG-928-K08]|nr:hypothetical protein [Eubacteriales bacterium OttesenSCG-928-K08]
MSAFLGPIHMKMYERILYQDSMAQKILDLATEKGWGGDFAKEVKAKAPAASRKPLESIIDEGNIHGWLSEAVAHCERRFALTVSGVLADHPERLSGLLDIMKKMGGEYVLPSSTDAQTAHQIVHDILLDGMPCDFPFASVDVTPDIVVWQVASCPHAPYWAEVHCDAEIYYQLRDAWMDGALSESGITHQRTAPHSHIMKKEHRNG